MVPSSVQDDHHLPDVVQIYTSERTMRGNLYDCLPSSLHLLGLLSDRVAITATETFRKSIKTKSKWND